MNRLLGYVILNSNEELIQWQRDRLNNDIVSIVPFVAGLKMECSGSIEGQFRQETAEGKTGVGVFVVYAMRPYLEEK